MEHMQANKEDEQYTMVYTGRITSRGSLRRDVPGEAEGQRSVVEVTCVPARNHVGRHPGAVDRFKELGGGKIIASNNGDAQVDLTLKVMEDFITASAPAAFRDLLL
jgi:ABC-type sugar transport system substrate-binding protein